MSGKARLAAGGRPQCFQRQKTAAVPIAFTYRVTELADRTKKHGKSRFSGQPSRRSWQRRGQINRRRRRFCRHISRSLRSTLARFHAHSPVPASGSCSIEARRRLGSNSACQRVIRRRSRRVNRAVHERHIYASDVIASRGESRECRNRGRAALRFIHEIDVVLIAAAGRCKSKTVLGRRWS